MRAFVTKLFHRSWLVYSFLATLYMLSLFFIAGFVKFNFITLGLGFFSLYGVVLLYSRLIIFWNVIVQLFLTGVFFFLAYIFYGQTVSIIFILFKITIEFSLLGHFSIFVDKIVIFKKQSQNNEQKKWNYLRSLSITPVKYLMDLWFFYRFLLTLSVIITSVITSIFCLKYILTGQPFLNIWDPDKFIFINKCINYSSSRIINTDHNELYIRWLALDLGHIFLKLPIIKYISMATSFSLSFLSMFYSLVYAKMAMLRDSPLNWHNALNGVKFLAFGCLAAAGASVAYNFNRIGDAAQNFSDIATKLDSELSDSRAIENVSKASEYVSVRMKNLYSKYPTEDSSADMSGSDSTTPSKKNLY